MQVEAAVDRARELSDSAIIDRIHGEPASNHISVTRAKETLDHMTLNEVLRDVVDVWDVIDEMPEELKKAFTRHAKITALPILVEQGDDA